MIRKNARILPVLRFLADAPKSPRFSGKAVCNPIPAFCKAVPVRGARRMGRGAAKARKTARKFIQTNQTVAGNFSRELEGCTA